MTIQSQIQLIIFKKKNISKTWFFAFLFFLCCADLFFSSRVHGFNFRWGQILLFLFALPALFRLKDAFQNRSTKNQMTLKFLYPWLPFFVVYGTAAIFSDTPLLTGIKWGWGIFNIALAAIVCLDNRDEDHLEKGFQWGILAITAFIWLETIAIYIFNALPTFEADGTTSVVYLLSIPIGYARSSFPYPFMNLNIYRPNAFYFEPSYAGCALTFAFFLLFFLDARRSRAKSGWIPAIVASAVILTGSRSGLVSELFFFIGILFLLALHHQFSPLLRSILKTLVLAVLLIGLFGFFPNDLKYLKFMAGPAGINAVSRIEDFIKKDLEKNNETLHTNPTPQIPEPTPPKELNQSLSPNASTAITHPTQNMESTPVPSTAELLKNYKPPTVYADEGDRLYNLKESYQLWMLHPLLGNGVVRKPDEKKGEGLSQFSMETWTEIGLESGILGVLTFLFAILANMTMAWKKSSDTDLKNLVLVVWIIHFGVQFLLSQTFPRLDYWLIFFLSIRLLVKSGESKTASSPRQSTSV